jgi:5'-nucleotidase
MRTLIVNDDGIESEGIMHLAMMAKRFGEVYVVAPARECSAMSQHITVREWIEVKEHDFPVSVEGAWSVGGAPADCIKVAMARILDFKPDYVFSGINHGYNAGSDLLYSGTVGAAMEALVQGIPAIAFSGGFEQRFEVLDEAVYDVCRRILEREADTGSIWNVNFPQSEDGIFRGILWDRSIAPYQYFKNTYEIRETGSGLLMMAGGEKFEQPEIMDDSDMSALRSGYISIGKVRCMVPLGAVNSNN